MGQEESVGSIEIKQVAVKAVDSSVANLRAAKEVGVMKLCIFGLYDSVRGKDWRCRKCVTHVTH